MKPRPQRGQALVESVLALPLVLLLTWGLLMLGHLLWLRVKLQAAAHAAARAYAVWHPEDPALARAKAEAAAWLALRPQPRGAGLSLVLPPWQARSAHEPDQHRTWLRGPLAQRLELRLRLRPLPGLARLWPQGLTLSAPALILSEDSLERDAVQR